MPVNSAKYLDAFRKFMYSAKMKIRRGRVIFIIATALAASAFYLFWQQGQPRWVALQSISRLASNLETPHGCELLDTVLMPVAVRSQTPAEHQEFIAKALHDEISPEGVLANSRCDLCWWRTGLGSLGVGELVSRVTSVHCQYYATNHDS
jgi:hypothetical protein